MSIRVVTDSACDLPQDVVDKHDLEVVPLTIRFGDEEFVDRVDLGPDEFWAKVASAPTLPETAAPSAGAFEAVFTRCFEEGASGIVCVPLASRLSATMQAAEVAAHAVADRGPVRVVDSKAVSLVQGTLAVVAAEHAAADESLDEVVAAVERAREASELYATVDTLENLRRGGRVGGAQALVGSMLSIKPIITLVEGEVQPLAKVRTRRKSLRWLVDKIAEGPVEHLGVVHGSAPDIDDFLAMIESVAPDTDVVVAQIGPVVGTHAGPGAIGVTFTRATA